MNSEPVQKIDPPGWMKNPATQKVMQVLDADQGSALFVGGCVRNQLLNKQVEDIDIATINNPKEVLEKLKQANIKAIPTGIEHGTVTAVIDAHSFEITTLRHDVETDGRHAKVSFTDDWVEDAKRRDFTMNTLLADIDGNIYDPLGQGIGDLQAKHIRFVGDPEKRIEEDYLRILRFFRFHAFYGEGEMNEEALQACQKASAQIQTLSRERITSEFLKILGSNRAPQALKIMFDHNVLGQLFKNTFKEQNLSRLIEIQHQMLSFGLAEGSIPQLNLDPAIKSQDDRSAGLMARLYVMNGYQPKFHEDVLRLTHKQKNFLVKLVMATQPEIFKNEKSLKKAIYHHGNNLMLQGYLVWLSKEGGEVDEALLDILQNWQAPECPITGEQLIAEGYVTGPDLGLELERRKEEWLQKNL